MMNLEVYAGMGVVIRKQDTDAYARVDKYLSEYPIEDGYRLLSAHEAGIYVVGDEDERNSLVVAIESTVQDFDIFSGKGFEPVAGAFEFSSLKVTDEEFRQLNRFLQDFEIEKPVDMVVWNHVSS